ncbi:lipoxygenase [Halenospora varia]|nr:lipoxygenase [Halenospora varia]
MGLIQALGKAYDKLVARKPPSPSRPSIVPTQNGFAHLGGWDHGVFKSEILKNDIFPRKLAVTDNDLTTPAEDIDDVLKEGAFDGIKRAATEMHHRIQQRSDSYPPHLDMVPMPVGAAVDFLSIFNFMRLLDTGLLLPRVILEKVLDFINDDPISETMAGIEARNHEIRVAKKNIGNKPETLAIDRIGPNPTTATKAGDWRAKFESQARSQGNQKLVDLFKNTAPDSLYVQDYSYFRDAIKANQNDILISDNGKRFGCASVCLFQLTAAGKLHPLAILLDYRGTIENSVTIFNRRLSLTDSSLSELQDWPWRYAKNLNVHLTETHLVEEVVIVATHKSFPTNHPDYRLMEPHWLKTLPLNAAARSTLVPGFIVFINGIITPQTYSFINDFLGITPDRESGD